ncbi:MAG: hypothetical protein QGG36_12840 [Pirellulaceae bacterium]|nr:hypothetical protein [Pirellulaceae bacterium]MDP7016684.1 hypothetical protein [Pirellulaceae bacterium]
MRRRRQRKTGLKVALFPFLAVLTCTMGALIVLLVMVVNQARSHAEQREDDLRLQQADELDEKRSQFAEFQWRAEVLEPQRKQLLNDLANKRNELAHLEEHIRALEKRARALLEQQVQLDLLDTQRNDQFEHQIAAAAAELERVRGEVEELKKQVANRRPSYAIIPYDGPNGTRRMPVYIECFDRKIVIHPEGIVLSDKDFDGSLGPGNPLDAALRAIREHYATARQVEPYPLLIVRPGGEFAYSWARSAMNNWDDEFGYELVPAEMKLKYRQADPGLKQTLEVVVQQARERQQLLAKVMPTRGRRGQQVGFVVRNRGGLQPVGGDTNQRPSGSNQGAGSGAGGEANGSSERFRDGGGDKSENEQQLNPYGASRDGQSAENKDVQTEGGPGGAATMPQVGGANWGLPKTNQNAQGYTKPVRVALLPDRVMILPARGELFAPKTTVYRDNSEEDIRRFVAQLWSYMERWGMAASGGYWVPVLSVDVAPGAEARFEEFQRLLKNSGIQVERKK